MLDKLRESLFVLEIAFFKCKKAFQYKKVIFNILVFVAKLKYVQKKEKS